MKAIDLYKEIHEYCVANANEEMVKKYSRYFKDGTYDAWGLTQTLLDAKKDDLRKRKFLTFDLIFETAPLLIKSGKYEETSFVLIMINLLSDEYTINAFEKLEALYDIGITNWAHADHLGMFTLPAFLNKGVVTKKHFIPWITSAKKFKRRCVPVTFIKLLKTESLEELLKIVDPLMLDPEREVHQGMGWFLREAWKLYPEQTEKYMLKYKDTAPRLIFQYACEKMDSSGKAKFKKERSTKA